MLKKIILYAVLAVVAYRLYTFGVILGIGITVFKHHPGPCRSIPGIEHGSEDMERIPGDKVLITSGLRVMARKNPNYAGRQGRIFLYDANKPQSGPQLVNIKNFPLLEDFDPHGLSVWVDKKSGEVSVFVVNHATSGDAIEIFTYNDKENTLYHKESVGRGDSNIHLLNDVLAVGKRQFYATNYLHTGYKAEMYLQFKWGSVVYYDGQKTRIVAQDNFLMTNGINMSPDGRFIYVVNGAERSLHTYNRQKDGSLALKEVTNLYTLLDNIVVDPDTGDLWIGSHARGIEILQYLDDPNSIQSSSQVLRLGVKDGSITSVTEVFKDDGKLISGSSVAILVKNQLLIGTVASNMVVCEPKYL